MDLFHFSSKDNPIMESLNRFSQISQSHANTLLRNKRLVGGQSERNNKLKLF